MIRATWVLFSALLAGIAQAADSNPDPCANPLFHQFDFWLGEWTVTDASGQFAGTNSITSEQHGCVVMEQWKSAKGGTGMSMNYYDARTAKWRQIWVGLGLTLEMSGELQNGSLVLEGPLYYLDDKRTTLLRGTWTPLPDGRVRQHFTESTDHGKSWSEWFDGYYKRVTRD
ncbi:MAG TPA: hypothetical protein VFS24_06615 [Steroidobacteraceae bacterium]|nr:hypothetical protein [Steroidobacteraceae bacterium]